MTDFEFISAPSAVAEQIGSNSRRYWVRTDCCIYRPMSARNFHLHVRFEAPQIRSEGRPTTTVVRCIAGLAPGVYRDSHGQFLNPESLRVVQPPQAAAPPPEFTELARRLVEVGGGFDSIDEWSAIREQMLGIYEKDRGVKRVSRLRGPWRRLIGRDGGIQGFPSDDHCKMFKGPHGYIWVSQPYVGFELPEVLGFAHQYDLEVTISPEWSWHHPGKTILIEWSRKPNNCKCHTCNLPNIRG
jgi:hypothetical protein